MSLTVTKTRTPVQFELIEKTDDRFQKAKIRIAHTGENLNNSYFSKETLDSMKDSLANIPIVAFIEKNKDDKDDFSDHRQEITIEDGDVKIRYAGHAYGFIPQDNNAHFELFGGKEWLVCEGYLWTKFQDAMSIFDESNGVKSQSMEIQDISGEVDDLGRLVITDGRFSALCILGDDVPPAMTGSTIQLYSAKINKREVDVMMSEFAELEAKLKKQKGGAANVNDETNESKKDVKDDEKVDNVDSLSGDGKDDKSKGDSQVDSDTGNHDDLSDGDVHDDSSDTDSEFNESSGDTHDSTDSDGMDSQDSEEDLGGVGSHGENDEADGEPDSSAVDGEESEEAGQEDHEDGAEEADTESFTQIIGNKEFQLTHTDIRGKLYKHIDELLSENEYSFIESVYSDHAIVYIANYIEDSRKYINVKYVEGETDITIETITEVFPMFLTSSEKARIEKDRKDIQSLTEQIEELQSYKNEIEYSQKQEIVKEFEDVIDGKKVADIYSRFNSMSVEDVKREVAFEVYEASRGNVETFNRTPVTNFDNGERDGRYGSLDVYFK